MMRVRQLDFPHGVSVIEVLVAVAVFAVVATALAQTLVAAQRARHTSANWLRATQLASERLERFRAGDRSTDTSPIGHFTRVWQSRGVPGYRELERVDVTVSWMDRDPRSFTLSALVRSPP